MPTLRPDFHNGSLVSFSVATKWEAIVSLNPCKQWTKQKRSLHSTTCPRRLPHWEADGNVQKIFVYFQNCFCALMGKIVEIQASFWVKLSKFTLRVLFPWHPWRLSWPFQRCRCRASWICSRHGRWISSQPAARCRWRGPRRFSTAKLSSTRFPTR